ncbi:MAG: c-type cytochrome [Nitrospira sp.]|nr:c-type cytochrome [bacterium]MBL7049204.1 c-type cytochrome [Nitrospira sp.]
MRKVIFTGFIFSILFSLFTQSAVHGVTKKSRIINKSGQQYEQWFNGKGITIDLSKERPEEFIVTISQGKMLFERLCTTCHGKKGDGQGVRAGDFITKPTDFTAGTYKFRSTPSGSIPADEDIFRTISIGVRGTAMLPWTALDDDDKWRLTYFLKDLSDRFSEEDVEESIDIPPAPASITGMLKQGAALYEKNKCFECHGLLGRGDGPKAADLKDDAGRKVRMPDFSKDPFKRGWEIGDIYRTLATGLDGTPMASYGDSISGNDLTALAAYVRSLNTAPTGMRRDEGRGVLIYWQGMTGAMGSGMMPDQ